MNKPTVHYDPQSDVLYFLVRDGEEERSVEVAEGVNFTVIECTLDPKGFGNP
jgi:uncharacterized protein YuzE